MTVTNLKKVLDYAVCKNIGIIGFVVHGWEDARAFVKAGIDVSEPIVIQAGPLCRRHTPLTVLGKMFRCLAEESNQDVVLHLDHATDIKTCKTALDEGFTSIMYDGSRLKLSDNIKNTIKISKLVEPYNASLEAELGYVGYTGGEQCTPTNACDVKTFLSETDIDALAVSVGNTHLQENSKAKIDYLNLKRIRKITSIPLVVHGASGISRSDRKKMFTSHGVKKFNIGTELRRAFGKSIRNTLKKNIDEYDRLKIFQAVEKDLQAVATVLLTEISQKQM